MTHDQTGDEPVMRYAISRSRLGRMLVARTHRGICYVAFGREPRSLERELHARFPQERIGRDDSGLKDDARAVAILLSSPGAPIGRSLDLRGTPFQRKVWKLLRAIPPGGTATYSELARKMGRPNAARAVANACAANPVAVVIPCHRVVRCDGGLGGYYWGIERKRMLLRWEADTVRESPNARPVRKGRRNA